MPIFSFVNGFFAYIILTEIFVVAAKLLVAKMESTHSDRERKEREREMRQRQRNRVRERPETERDKS